MIDVAILGASGFVGAELLRLCAGHPALRPARLFGDSQAGAALGEVHPHLALAYPDARSSSSQPAALDGVDLVFAALPHGQSQAIAPEIIARGIPFVDLGADFRLDDAADYRALVRRAAPGARRCWAGSSTAFRSCTAPRSPRRRRSRPPAATRPRRSSR